MSGSGLALARIPIEQDAAYWEWHVKLPGLPRHPSEDEELEDVQMDEDDDPYAVQFGVATRKDRNFYRLLERVEEEGGMVDINAIELLLNPRLYYIDFLFFYWLTITKR